MILNDEEIEDLLTSEGPVRYDKGHLRDTIADLKRQLALVELQNRGLIEADKRVQQRVDEAVLAEAEWWADHDVEDYDTQSQWDELAAERVAAARSRVQGKPPQEEE